MASRILQRMAGAAVLVGAIGLGLASSAAARPVGPARPRVARGFQLFAGTADVMLNVNRVQCLIASKGRNCVAPGNSTTTGGGFWPKGSPDEYIYQAGLQIAAIIPGVKTAAFPWPGDTVGAFFMDPTGQIEMGEAVNPGVNSLNSGDVANWPNVAIARDTSIFDPALIGRISVSQQDSWTRYWDGNAALGGSGRTHPMGVMVDQRSMAWNFPTGNDDIIYFVVRFINITSGVRTDYDGLSVNGYQPQDIDSIFTVAQDFRTRMNAKYNITIPLGGFQWSQTFAGWAEDADVGDDANQNYGNGNFVFDMVYTWKRNWQSVGWQYPPAIFGAPFFAGPGFTAAKYLSTPGNLGVVMAGNTTNPSSTPSPFPDAGNVRRLWRNLSGNLLVSDGQCSFPGQALARRFCYWAQAFSDARVYGASGPMTINPGQLKQTVIAVIHAAPVGTSPAAAPPFGPPLPAWNISAWVGLDMKPGYALEGSRLLAQTDTIRNVDRAAGWMNHTNDINGNGRIDQNEVITQPRSLYAKGLVAQAVFDKKFLLPAAPEAPDFFMVPGDNQVTLTWRPTVTETSGDPYYPVASNPLNPNLTVNTLYDPNFRRFDVEGYRIWRGRTQAEMVVIAAFDKAGTTMADYTQEFFSQNFPNCAPELGLSGPPNCAVAFTTPTSAIVSTSPHTSIALNGDVVQVTAGGRSQLASLNLIHLGLDTAITGGGNPNGYPGLTDTGIPFAYTDHSVRNGFTYVYAVTAFDLNSAASGPSSLESPLVTKSVIPRVPSGQEVPGVLGAMQLVGGDGSTLNPGAALPTLDATTSIFSGPMPPTNALTLGFGAFIPQVLASGAVTVTIDSVVPGSWFNQSAAATYFFSGQGAGPAVKFTVAILGAVTSSVTDAKASNAFLATNMDSAAAARFGGNQSFALYGSAGIQVNGDYRYTNQYRAAVNGDPAAGTSAGPRWWTGAANENTNDPNGINCMNTVAGFSCTLADLSKNAGSLGAGVGIMNIASYGTIGTTEPIRTIEGITSSVFRAADFKWYWGANGVVDSVVDVTHRVRVPFSPKIRASWGILNDSSFTHVVNKQSTQDTSITRLTWADAACIAPAPHRAGSCGGVANFGSTLVGAVLVPDSGAFLMNHARLSPVSFASSTYPNTRALSAAAATGNGFILYLSGHFFLMQMASFPAAGTVWNMRTYAGNITGASGTYAYVPATRPAAVPGLRFKIGYTGSTFDPTVANDSLLQNVHTVPDPYYVTNALELSSTTKVLRFVNLPAQAIIRIYSASGILVNILTHNDQGGGSEQVWNLRNRNNQFVASGVYFYHVETPDGRAKVGRFTVVNYAQ